MSLPQSAIGRLRSALDEFEAERLDVDRFCLEWRRALLDLGSALPADLAETAEALLMRMESARWFSGEACGFSGKDLAIALRRWLAAVEAAPPLAAGKV
ncbi:MAG: hypothetical protein FGM40_01560 [Rhodocyclaceae bacterium]|nr:hypothetical protein [Rhodocyclaceae bacterium]